MDRELRRKTKSALIWNGVNQLGRFGFRFFVTVILARLLAPKDFGLIAMITVITSISDLFIDSGFRVGIVQKREISNEELSSVFLLNGLIGLFFTITIFAAAPLIASIYGDNRLINLTKAMSIVYFFNSLSVVQRGILSRKMEFKKQTISVLLAQIIAGVIALCAAKYGLGVWSLVLDLILQSLLMSIFFWVQSSWRPNLILKFSSIRALWGFSYKLLLMNLLSTLGNKVDYFFIGKLFSPQELGLYSKSKDFSLLPSKIGTQVITTSFFPVFAQIQDDPDQFTQTYVKLYRIIMLIFTPVFSIMFLEAHQIIPLMLGKGWQSAGVYFKWASIIGLFYVVNGLLNYIVNSKGRSDLNLMRSCINAPIRIGCFILVPYVFKNFTPLYYIFIYIMFFLTENLFNKYFISRISGFKYSLNLILGGEFILIAIIIIIVLTKVNQLIQIHSLILGIIINTFLFLGAYFSCLILCKDKTLFWIINNIKRKLQIYYGIG